MPHTCRMPRHAHFTNATNMLHVPHMHAYAGRMHAAHTPLHMSYTHRMLVTFTLHTPNMPYTCHKPVLCMLHMHCILAMEVQCKKATNLLHVHSMHIQCMRAPRKQHSSCTHATLTCITDATYATCASMLQEGQRHTLCACCIQTTCHTCMHACHTHTKYIASTLMSCIMQLCTYTACMHTIPTEAGYLLLHVYFMQNTCKHFHACTH